MTSTAPTARPTAGPTLEGIPTMEKSTIVDFKASVLYKGGSGTGKSFAAATWPTPIVGAYFDPNAATTKGFIEAGSDIKFYMIQNWAQFAERFVPMVANRLLRARTVVIEGVHHLADMMWRDIQGGAGKLTQQNFGTGKTRQMDIWRQLTDGAKAIPGKPSYNIIATTQLKDDTDDSGALLGIKPNLMGAFQGMLEGYFNTVLLCEVEVVGETVTNNGVSAVQRTPKWSVHTIPPSKYHTCKDSIGGHGGRKKLPAKTGGTYLELCAAWGCEPEPSGWPGEPPAMKPINE